MANQYLTRWTGATHAKYSLSEARGRLRYEFNYWHGDDISGPIEDLGNPWTRNALDDGIASCAVLDSPHYLAKHSRKADYGFRVPDSAKIGLESRFSFELNVKFTQPGRYVLVQAEGNNELEILFEISLKPGSSSEYVFKFGLGFGSWNINASSIHQHAFVYSEAVEDVVFDDKWHQIVASFNAGDYLDLPPGRRWKGEDLSIFVDGEDLTDTSTRSEYSTTHGLLPANFKTPVTLHGPQEGVNEHEHFASFTILHANGLTQSMVYERWNTFQALNTTFEVHTSNELTKYTGGYLETVEELTTLGTLKLTGPEVTFDLSGSFEVDIPRKGSIVHSIGFTDVDSGIFNIGDLGMDEAEPSYEVDKSSYWFEVPFDSDENDKVYFSIDDTNGSGFKLNVYKNPALFSYSSEESAPELDNPSFMEDEFNPFGGIRDNYDPYEEYTVVSPKYEGLTSVAGIHSDSSNYVEFALDEEYFGPYYVQLILSSGSGEGIEISWGSADGSVGDVFDDPISLSETESGRNDDGDTSFARIEPSEPFNDDLAEAFTPARSVWYEWIAPSEIEEAVTWSAGIPDESSFSIEIFSGTSIDNLTEVTHALSSNGEDIDVEFTPIPETTYRIKVASASAQSPVALVWSTKVEPLPAADPVSHLRVTVHAGAAGAVYGSNTYTPNSMIAELPNRKGLQFQDTLNTPGSGSLTVLQNDPLMRSFAPAGWDVSSNGVPSGFTQLGTLKSAVAAKGTQIEFAVAPVGRLGVGMILQVGTPSGTTELVRIKRAYSLTKFELTHALKNSYAAGSVIFSHLQPYDDPFRLLQVGNFVKVWMNEKCVFAFIIKNRNIPVVGSGEEAEKTITVSGPSIHALLSDIVVHHDNLGVDYSTEDRYFDWTSSVKSSDLWSYGGWFDNTAGYSTHKKSWNHPIKTNTITKPPGYRKKRSEAYKNRPKYALARLKKTKRFPDYTAKWMWMDKYAAERLSPKLKLSSSKSFKVHHYKSKSVTIPKTGRYRIFVVCDTKYQIYLDGKLIMAGNGLEKYDKIHTKDITLYKTDSSIRPNSFSVFVGDQYNSYKKKSTKKKTKSKKQKKVLQNTKYDADRNDAFLLSVIKLNAKGKIPEKNKKVVLRSGGTTRWYAFHGDAPPQWSKAQVLMTLLREGRERNNDAAKLLYNATMASGITKKLDKYSSDKGQPAWSDLKKDAHTVKIGTSLLDLQFGFSETNKFDVWVDPNTCRIYAYQGGANKLSPKGVDRSANIALIPGHNLVSYSIAEVDNMINYLLVQYSSEDKPAFVAAEPSLGTSLAERSDKYGTREGYLEAGGLHSALAAEKYGLAIMSSMSDTSKIGGTDDIVGHVNNSYTGSIVPMRGCVPFLDFEVGDTISAPGYNGIMGLHRVLSLSCTEDDEGNLTFEPEIEGS